MIAAYVFSRTRFRWKRTIFGAVMLGQTFPWIVLVTPVFILFARLGLLNSYAGMVFCYVAITIPFSIYLLVGYLESVPRSLDETAIIDGCPRFQVIWRIVFPIMLPGVVATATYSFLLCWSEYLFALAFLTRTEMKTMPLALYAFFGEHTTEWGQVMAASALITLPDAPPLPAAPDEAHGRPGRRFRQAVARVVRVRSTGRRAGPPAPAEEAPGRPVPLARIFPRSGPPSPYTLRGKFSSGLGLAWAARSHATCLSLRPAPTRGRRTSAIHTKGDLL